MQHHNALQSLELQGNIYEIRGLDSTDESPLVDFLISLPEHDLLYTPRNLADPVEVNSWMRAAEEGDISTIIAIQNNSVAGWATLIVDPLSWSPHVGEIRVLVAPSHRQQGLGRALIDNRFTLAKDMGLQKLIARMTIDQQGAFAVFETLGFKGEALFISHVRDKKGASHDIAQLSYHLG